MTEEQARTKWCPMVRTSALREGNPTGAVTNQCDESYVATTCIASDCMMWRVGALSNGSYCGLAGKL